MIKKALYQINDTGLNMILSLLDSSNLIVHQVLLVSPHLTDLLEVRYLFGI